MKERCWQCGGKLALPYYAEILDLDGNKIRVHKVCKPDAERFFRPPNLGDPEVYISKRVVY